MEAFKIEIAGLAAQIQPIFCSTREYCRRYLTQREPELFIAVTPEALRYEQAMLDLEADEEGLKRRVFTGPFLERAAIQRGLADALLQRNALLLHGSAVAVDGRAYLFTARCGEGKSTHTRLWREVFGSRAVMVNDDKPFLQLTDRGILAYGSPFSGKHGLDTNMHAPLAGICILHRDTRTWIRRITGAEAAQSLLHQSHIPEKPQLRQQAEMLVASLADRLPLWEMGCTKEPEAARISYEAMSAAYSGGAQ